VVIAKVKKKKFVVDVLDQNNGVCLDMGSKDVDHLVAISIVTILPNDTEKTAKKKIKKELMKTEAHLLDKYYTKKEEESN